MALLCMEFELFLAKYLHLKRYEIAITRLSISIMYVSLFQIQNLCQFWAKLDFLKIQLFYFCLLSYYHHLRAKFGMYIMPSHLLLFWNGVYLLFKRPK